jgi:hypothetical protein
MWPDLLKEFTASGGIVDTKEDVGSEVWCGPRPQHCRLDVVEL